jgi:hypothetical protein
MVACFIQWTLYVISGSAGRFSAELGLPGAEVEGLLKTKSTRLVLLLYQSFSPTIIRPWDKNQRKSLDPLAPKGCLTAYSVLEA